MGNINSAIEQSSLPDLNPTFDTGLPIVNESNEDAKKVRYIIIHAFTTRALGRAHVPPTKVFRWLSVNKTILKPRLAAATGGQYVYVRFSRRNKFPRCSAYTTSEKAIRFRHPDHIPDLAQMLISSPMSRHLSCRHATFHPNPCTCF